MEHTEATIQRILGKTYGIERGYITMPNVLIMDKGMYEADFIYINKHDYLTEVEIKISISDFKADFEKKHYHDSPKVRALYYAIPRELLDKHRDVIIPMARNVGAGVIVCEKTTCSVYEKAKLRKVEPLRDDEKTYYMRLGCLKWINRWDLQGG